MWEGERGAQGVYACVEEELGGGVECEARDEVLCPAVFVFVLWSEGDCTYLEVYRIPRPKTFAHLIKGDLCRNTLMCEYPC